MTDAAFCIVLMLCTVVLGLAGYIYWVLDPRRPWRVKQARHWWWGRRIRKRPLPQSTALFVAFDEPPRVPLPIEVCDDDGDRVAAAVLKPYLDPDTRN